MHFDTNSLERTNRELKCQCIQFLHNMQSAVGCDAQSQTNQKAKHKNKNDGLQMAHRENKIIIKLK